MAYSPDRRRQRLARRLGRHGPGTRKTKRQGAVVYIRENRKTARVSLGFMNILRQKLWWANQPSVNAPVRTLADMTPEEKAALELRYGAKIKA